MHLVLVKPHIAVFLLLAQFPPHGVLGGPSCGGLRQNSLLEAADCCLCVWSTFGLGVYLLIHTQIAATLAIVNNAAMSLGAQVSLLSMCRVYTLGWRLLSLLARFSEKLRSCPRALPSRVQPSSRVQSAPPFLTLELSLCLASNCLNRHTVVPYCDVGLRLES